MQIILRILEHMRYCTPFARTRIENEITPRPTRIRYCRFYSNINYFHIYLKKVCKYQKYVYLYIIIIYIFIMTLTIKNIEKAVEKATKNALVKFDVTYDCGNAYVSINGSLNAITSVIFNEDGNFEAVYTMQYKEEVLDENEEPTGEFDQVENELYMGNSLKTALDKLRLSS